jgi:pimeloyl-ACP methyl ester carboxylesterase
MTAAGSGEQFARAGEIELAYEVFGDPGDPPVLMLMGLGSQMIHWPDGFCELLAGRGYRLIRFDNREAGRSTRLDGTPSRLAELMRGVKVAPPYLLADLAADSVGLLDALGVDRAHVVGASFGGMVAQQIAIDFPQRVLSLASIMSTTGDRSVGEASEAATQLLMTRPATEREAYIEGAVAGRKVLGSVEGLRDDDLVREVAARAFDRGLYPEGTGRQLAAILGSPDRTPSLRELDVPTVVIHGAIDPLIGVSGGRATAAAIPDAELLIIDGMGHDLPPGAWERIVDALTRNFDRAQAVSASA